MTVADSPVHEDRHVVRHCDICGFFIRFECYPRTGPNQRIARYESGKELAKHIIETHSVKELVDYLNRIHQISSPPPSDYKPDNEFSR